MTMKGKVLIVEDEKDLVKMIRYNLEKEQYRVLSANDAESGLQTAKKNRPDVIVLDIMLPKMDGLEFLRAYRRDSRTPVVLLSAKRNENDRILGLKMGADDYMVKPFSIGELQARIEGLLRRATTPIDDQKPFTVGALQVDFERHEILIRGKRVDLTTKEFEILKLLIEANGKVLSRDLLLEKIWGHGQDVEIDTRTVDQHIARLRHKLKQEAARIATVTNFGYQMRMN
jgi:two-component system, OmpR family, alkaline phosphatase synthesis response regulator PhoP